MTASIEMEDLILGNNEEFNRRSFESYRECLEWIRNFIKIIYCIPSECCCSNTSLPRCFKYFFTKNYIAKTVLLLSLVISIAAFITLNGLKLLGIVMYCLSFFACSIISLCFKRGEGMFAILYEEMEEQEQEQIDLRDLQEPDQPAKDVAEDEKHLLHKSLKNLMETKTETETTSSKRRTLRIPWEFHHSDSYTPLNHDDYSSAGPSHTSDPYPPMGYGYDNSAGPSHAPDPYPPLHHGHDSSTRAFHTNEAREITSGVSFEDTTDLFTITHLDEDSYDSDEPFQRLSEARISADAVKAFGPPLHVLGADSYRIFHSSDENCSSD